jgi:hypothetical protein
MDLKYRATLSASREWLASLLPGMIHYSTAKAGAAKSAVNQDSVQTFDL